MLEVFLMTSLQNSERLKTILFCDSWMNLVCQQKSDFFSRIKKASKEQHFSE